ncbi:hypothetical protein [Lysobacter sp. Root494]|uniref:hypothetical protein n=1 Tax=Lysobacter sp. Root494 TaxID=1736549 RepID=UPI000A6FA6A1|nr:hypothetical protein [Lysobacter sp. Root494]
MNRKYIHIAALLVALSPLIAQAGTVRTEVAKDLDDARQEVRTELAQERARLDSENLSLGEGLHFGREDKDEAAKRRPLPKGEITPRGDLLIDGKAVALDAAQRRQVLNYRAQVIGIARTGIDAGERAAMLAIEATDVSLFRLIAGGLTGSLERRVEATVQREIQPMVLQICHRLPQLRDSQQALAASVPEFRPYATLDNDDVENCERDMRKDLATR